MKSIQPELVQRLRSYLGYDGCAFFSMCKEEYDTVSPVWIIYFEPLPKGPIGRMVAKARPNNGFPHAVHFREGMQVRNFMRSSGLCEGWNDHDFDNNWKIAIEKVLECIHFMDKL